jgi:hypothetical protein
MAFDSPLNRSHHSLRQQHRIIHRCDELGLRVISWPRSRKEATMLAATNSDRHRLPTRITISQLFNLSRRENTPKWTRQRSLQNWKPNGTGSTVPLQPYVKIESHSARLPVSRMGGNGTTQQQPGGSSAELQGSGGKSGGRKERRHDFGPIR